MKVRPLHDRVVVRRLEEERKTASGIVIPDAATEKPDQGEIIAVGKGKIGDDGKLVPMTVKVGDKVLSTKTRKVINRAAVAFRMAAYASGKSHTALGAYYRRLRSRLDAPKAITATARKLSCLFYRLLKHGNGYIEQGMDYYETRYKERAIKNLKNRAQELGFNLIENTIS